MMINSTIFQSNKMEVKSMKNRVRETRIKIKILIISHSNKMEVKYMC